MGITGKTLALAGRAGWPGAVGRCCGLLALAAMAALACPAVAIADDVVLKTRDGSFEIRGDLVGSDGGFLTVRTTMGQVRVPMDQVTCAGPGCPAAMQGQQDAGAGGTASPEGPGDRTDLTIGVSAALPQDLVDRLVAAYGDAEGTSVAAEADNRAWTITGPAGSFRLALAGAGASDLRIETAGATDDAGVRLVLALETIAVVTAPGSRPAALSIRDLAEIYAGRARDWADLNNRSGPIVPVLPDDDPAIERVMRSQILGARAPASTITRAGDVPGFLLSTPGSIALVRGSAGWGLKPMPLSGDCGLTAGAGAFAVRSGQYPLVRPVVLRAGGGDLAAPVQTFLDFAGSEAGQDALGTTGLVGQSIIRASPEWQADWIASAAKLSEFVGGGGDARRVLQELIDTAANASRLSVTLRYVYDREDPDATARGDFARLAAAIAGGALDGSEITFIGYTDAGSAITQGRTTSATAAQRVLRDFAAAHPAARERPGIKFSTTGFGGIAPLVCSGSAAERAVNQRVEVWIRPL